VSAATLREPSTPTPGEKLAARPPLVPRPRMIAPKIPRPKSWGTAEFLGHACPGILHHLMQENGDRSEFWPHERASEFSGLARPLRRKVMRLHHVKGSPARTARAIWPSANSNTSPIYEMHAAWSTRWRVSRRHMVVDVARPTRCRKFASLSTSIDEAVGLWPKFAGRIVECDCVHGGVG
jgi:hypothetical protein